MKRTTLALVAAPVLALGLAACGGSTPAPAPVVTVTAPAPTPTQEDITQTSGYILTQAIMQVAWDKQPNPQLLCIAWATDRQKWTNQFAASAPATVPYDQASAAVEDFFDDKCASDV
jgi:ABC-type glycerol-3-phosphate transport system substrate-binding protein